MGRDGTSFPRWGWLSLNHITARHRRRWFSGVRRLGERLDILGRSRLQTRLPELLKSRYLFSFCHFNQRFCYSSRHPIIPWNISEKPFGNNVLGVFKSDGFMVSVIQIPIRSVDPEGLIINVSIPFLIHLIHDTSENCRIHENKLKVSKRVSYCFPKEETSCLPVPSFILTIPIKTF